MNKRSHIVKQIIHRFVLVYQEIRKASDTKHGNPKEE